MAEASNKQAEWSVFSKRTKILIIVLASWGGFFSPVSAAIYFPAIETLAQEFHKSTGVINLTVTTYMIFQGLAPSFFGVLSEQIGKRPVYLITFFIYIAANIGLALQSNYVALLILRCLQSSGSSATIALAIGTAGDIARGSERGTFVGWTASGFLIGPAIGPIIGGLLAGSLSWRAIFWFLTIMAVVYISVYALICPETARTIVGNGSITPPRLNRSLLQIIAENRTRQALMVASSDLERNQPTGRDEAKRPSENESAAIKKASGPTEEETNRPLEGTEPKETLNLDLPATQSERPTQGSHSLDHVSSDPEKEEEAGETSSQRITSGGSFKPEEGQDNPAKVVKKRKFRIPNPMKSLVVLKEPDIAIILFYNSLLVAPTYQMMASTVTIFKDLYGYTDDVIGLCYMPFGAATMIGSFLGGRISDWNLKRIAKKVNFEVDRNDNSADSLAFPWEVARLQVAAPLSLVGSCLILVYGWTVQWHITVAVPLIVQFFIGLTLPVAMNAFSVMVVDRYPHRAASASAANNFTRCLIGAGATAVIDPMLDAMGRGGCFSFVGGVLLLLSPLMWILLKYGPTWRKQRMMRNPES